MKKGEVDIWLAGMVLFLVVLVVLLLGFLFVSNSKESTDAVNSDNDLTGAPSLPPDIVVIEPPTDLDNEILVSRIIEHEDGRIEHRTETINLDEES